MICGVAKKSKNCFQYTAKIGKFAASMRTIFINILICCLTAACGNRSENKPAWDVQQYEQNILTLRKNRDNQFAGSNNSPFARLTDEFTGLKYFDVDTTFRVIGKYVPHTDDTILNVKVPDTKGGLRLYLYDGDVVFYLKGKKYSLPALQDTANKKQFFFMFKDLSNGGETYKGGRYLDAEMDEEKNIILDFNLAYNPYCHYNELYSCPIVPEHHVLDVAIEAGEKKYK